MFKKAFAALAGLTAMFTFGLLSGWLAHRWLPTGPAMSGPVLLARVQNLNQYVSVKYVLEKVVVFEDAKWYGNSRVTLVAHGVAKAGIDFAMLKPEDIQTEGRSITITLPPAKITDVYLDDRRTEVLERSTGLLRSFDNNLEQSARTVAVASLREAAEQGGILTDATERAKAELGALLRQSGFTTVEFTQQK